MLIGIGLPKTRVPAVPLAVPGSLGLGAVIICLPLQRWEPGAGPETITAKGKFGEPILPVEKSLLSE